MITHSKENNGYKYIISIIDCFTRFAWMIPIKNKKGETIRDELYVLFKKEHPKFLWADQGSEFYNKHVEKFIPYQFNEFSKFICL